MLNIFAFKHTWMAVLPSSNRLPTLLKRPFIQRFRSKEPISLMAKQKYWNYFSPSPRIWVQRFNWICQMLGPNIGWQKKEAWVCACKATPSKDNCTFARLVSIPILHKKHEWPQRFFKKKYYSLLQQICLRFLIRVQGTQFFIDKK